MKELTREEVIRYMKAQGTGLDEHLNPIEEDIQWWLTCPTRREQIIECVRNNYSLIDYDEWQQIQDVLFGNDVDTLSFKTAMKITCALWEEDIEVLELPSLVER